MRQVDFNFEDANFVVVGASSGIGRQIALDLAKSGANVLAVARNEKRLRELQENFPERISISILDVLEADQEAWGDMIGAFVEKHGKINGGVYTAGIAGTTALRVYDVDLAYRIFETSCWGMIRFMQTCSKKKYAEKGSSFVVFSSIAAHRGNKGKFAYSGAKAAVQAEVRSIAKEICRDMHRINSISPGWVTTELTNGFKSRTGMERPQDVANMNLLEEAGQPKDISGMTLFLLSDAAQWITGTDIVIDGGSLIGRH